MVIDASAIVACLLDEPERITFINAIDAAPVRLMSVVGFVEVSLLILRHKNAPGLADLMHFVDRAQIERVMADGQQADIAIDAFQRFGKGRHPARLNIGDCFAYALAKSTGEPLLFKGNDFARTDVVSAIGS